MPRTVSDDTYRAAGAKIVDGAAELWAGVRHRVQGAACPTPDEVGLMREGGTLISFIWPAQNPELMQQLAAKKATVLAIDCAAAHAVAAPRRWTR